MEKSNQLHQDTDLRAGQQAPSCSSSPQIMAPVLSAWLALVESNLLGGLSTSKAWGSKFSPLDMLFPLLLSKTYPEKDLHYPGDVCPVQSLVSYKDFLLAISCVWVVCSGKTLHSVCNMLCLSAEVLLASLHGCLWVLQLHNGAPVINCKFLGASFFTPV